jgi:hypothetical protein
MRSPGILATVQYELGSSGRLIGLRSRSTELYQNKVSKMTTKAGLLSMAVDIVRFQYIVVDRCSTDAPGMPSYEQRLLIGRR